MDDAASALRTAARALERVSDTARLDAELLLAHALGVNRDQLLLDMPKLDAPEDFQKLVARRMTHEPVAHIVGTREFWGLEFQVSPDVLIPRPDSETLIEEAARLFAGSPPAHILDLGTGSGALLLAALSEFPQAKGMGMDASASALAIAHNNADALGLSDRATFMLLDWTKENWAQAFHRKYDLVLANPPYIDTTAQLSPEVHEFEPHQALFAGEKGMDDYNILIPALDKLLADGGAALFEIGFDQRKPVSDVSDKYGYNTQNKQDLGGNDRVLILRKK